MSRVGARREREGVVPRATGVPRLAKPARHARYAQEVAPRRPSVAIDASGCRAYLVCRAGFAGRDTPLAQAIERYNPLSGPDPRCISGRSASAPQGTTKAAPFMPRLRAWKSQ